jgi:hypothetical protein
MKNIHVLHITCDYPDTVRAEKTRAVSNLISGSRGLCHTVFSLNRSNRPFSCQRTDNVYAINYCAPPLGIFLRQGLNRICHRLRSLADFDFDVVHAHKFSIEGLIGAHVAEAFGKPLLITVRGHTDLNIMRAKPHYRRHYREVARQAAHIFFLAPWTCRPFRKALGLQLNDSSFLPNIIQRRPLPEPRISERFVTTVNYGSKNHYAKNIDTLLRGLRKVVRRPGYDRYGLDLYTTPECMPAKIRSLVSSPLLADRVRIKSIVSNEDFVKALPNYVAFVRPSYPETFGMVYLESLLAGIPAMHARNTAIDGYFDDYDFIKKVSPRSVHDISRTLMDLIDNQSRVKDLLSRHLFFGTFQPFYQKNIIEKYEETVTKIYTSSMRSKKIHPAA